MKVRVGVSCNSNGDGIGDTSRGSYAGWTAIWLIAFQPSLCRNGGYDISDYQCVNSRHGTLGDFVESAGEPCACQPGVLEYRVRCTQKPECDSFCEGLAILPASERGVVDAAMLMNPSRLI
jgi:hypothetical protein